MSGGWNSERWPDEPPAALAPLASGPRVCIELLADTQR